MNDETTNRIGVASTEPACVVHGGGYQVTREQSILPDPFGLFSHWPFRQGLRPTKCLLIVR